MRVLLVCTGLNDLGGANRHLATIYQNLSKKGFEIFIVCSSLAPDALKNFFLFSKIDERHLYFIPRWHKWFLIPMVFSLVRAFRILRPDVVHSFGIQSDAFCGLAAKIAPASNMYAYYESSPLTANSGWLKNIFYRTMNRLVKDQFRQTVAVSEGIKMELVKVKLRCPNKIKVIYVGIEIGSSTVDFQKKIAHFSQNNPVIGTIARFSPEKGLDRFLRAAVIVQKQIPQAQFVLIGDGQQKNEMIVLAHKLNLEKHVEFRGWTAHPRLDMEQFDLFVMPSLREGCPNTLLEALSAGCPVVASDIPGINEVIRDHQDGILVDTACAERFAEAINTMCTDPQKAVQLAKSGYQRVREKFTVEKEMEALKELYQKGL